MDRLERELRDVLTSERRALPSSLVPLERVHARAARRRHRRRVVAGTAALVAAVAVVVPVGLSLGPGPDRAPVADNSPTPTTSESPAPTPSDSPSPTPSGLAWVGKLPLSVTATSTRTFVVLGGVGGPCPAGCLRLTQSNDGGKTFTALPLPAEIGQTGTVPTKDGVQSVRFGSGDDGWLFGGDLWSSHDGGYSWKHVLLPGPVVRLEAAAGSAWALVGSGKNDDRLQLWTSSMGADAWSRVPDVGVTGPADLSVQGRRVVVLGAQDSRLWVGGPAGFAEHPSPCPGATSVRMSSVGAIWATCGTGMSAALHVSDDGVDWSSVWPEGLAGSWSNGVQVGARTDRDALVVDGVVSSLSRLAVDGTLTPVSSPPPMGAGTEYIGFTTPQVGYAIIGGDVWRTADGGDTWRRLALG